MATVGWWVITHEQQVVSACLIVAAVGVTAVLVGLAGVVLARLRRTGQLVDHLIEKPVPVFERGRAGVLPVSDEELLDLADVCGVRR